MLEYFRFIEKLQKKWYRQFSPSLHPGSPNAYILNSHAPFVRTKTLTLVGYY